MAERTQRLDETTQAVRTMEWDVEAALEKEELEARTVREELVLGRYRLGRRLGSGGFGTVWSASDERLRREVAIKVIPREHTADDRAGREARVAARLNHPNVVALYELGVDHDNVYLVSELVEGRTLAELIAEDALSDRDIARIGAALCDGLAHAHGRGVVHRDVKPQNVMVVAQPARGSGFAKLTDFGVAHLAGDEPLTRTGDVVGTLAYMAPEQAEGRRVTWEADVYSLALSLYEAWTGVNPVRRRGPAATARQLGKPITSLGRMRGDLPPELVTAIDLALAPQPDRRPGPEELAEVLRAVARELSDEGALEEEKLRDGKRRRIRVGWRARVFTGACSGGLVAAVLVASGAPATEVHPAAAAGIAALAVALLPRLGWIAAVVALCAWLVSPEVGQEGTAAYVAAACLPVPLLLPRAPAFWSVPGFAPLLGLANAGAGYTAIAGQAVTWPRRAALGVLGSLWIALADDSLADPRPAALTTVAFALAAILLPLLVRGLRFALDLIAAAVWAGALYAALAGIERLAGPGMDLRGAAAGSVLAAVTAVTAAAVRRSRARSPENRARPEHGGARPVS
ncbi:MAG TPA: serine/threonine-protein kinase [Thermoleophilaceae bacterium]|nr:serine/threonine-protein kinase [Thermoleophilaceae bacterium]